MDDLRYKVELLAAMNEKLTLREKMYSYIFKTSANAFLYQNFEEDLVVSIGNWNQFFSFDVKDSSDIVKIFDTVEDEYVIPVRDVLFLEKRQLPKDSIDIKMKNKRSWYECECHVSYDAQGKPIEKVIRFKDISKFKTQNDELTYMAYYDMLTGLYNRNYFVRLLGEYVRKAQEENSVISVLFIDIDDFRKINDGMGIVIGDELVQVFGQYLDTFSQENVMVCHVNSDIYCMAIYDPCGARSVEHIYKQIHDRLQDGFVLSSGLEMTVTASIGVAEFPEAAKNALELINCAEIVMFKAKTSGKNTIQYFDAPILNEFLNNVQIENKLKEAVFNQNFSLKFQPQYYADGNRLRGVEALIRWRDDNGDMISPSVFIPIAEKNGTIIPIGNWVMGEAIRQYAEWKKKYGYEMTMSINISALQYKRMDFISNLVEQATKYHVKPEEIELEITETVLIDDFSAVIEKMLVLQEYGFKVSLDDFGTGFSSLSYLSGLPINTIKIDKSFIDSVLTDEATKIIMDSIVQMVKKLGFETIAEGVERQEQLEYLQSINCDAIQGFLLGKPMDPEDIEQLIIRLL